MMTKMRYSEVRDLMETVTTQTYGSSARAHYALGALESILSHMVAELPKHKQAEFARDIQFLANRISEIK
jgi:hypothetical protein